MVAIEAGLKRALEWIADQLRDNPRAGRLALVDEASRRFGLSPLEGEYLCRHVLSPGRVEAEPRARGCESREPRAETGSAVDLDCSNREQDR